MTALEDKLTAGGLRLCAVRREYGPELADLFPSEAVARRALRRQVLRGRPQHGNLLPSNLPRPHRQGEQRALLSERRGRRRSWLSPLPAVPPGMFSWNSRLVRNPQHGGARAAAHRREQFG